MDPRGLLAGVNITLRVRIPGHVEPVARPLLAVVGRGEEPIDQSLVGVRPLVGDERFDLLAASAAGRSA